MQVEGQFRFSLGFAVDSQSLAMTSLVIVRDAFQNFLGKFLHIARFAPMAAHAAWIGAKAMQRGGALLNDYR
jgi:hypothetical protein